jgi:hypothetical protein
MSRGFWILALILGAYGRTAAAAADNIRLGIFANIAAREGDIAPIETTRLLETLARDADYALGVTVVRPSELLTTDAGRGVTECGADLKCVGVRLLGAGIDLALVATVDASADTALVLVMLVRGSTANVEGRIIDEIPAGDAAGIEAAIEKSAIRLLEQAGHPIGGRLYVRLSPADASLSVRDSLGKELSIAAGTTHVLAPGKYFAVARKEDHQERAAEVEVARKADAELALALEPAGAWYDSPWVWIGLGALAISGGVVAGLAVAGEREPGEPPIEGDDGRIIFTLGIGR